MSQCMKRELLVMKTGSIVSHAYIFSFSFNWHIHQKSHHWLGMSSQEKLWHTAFYKSDTLSCDWPTTASKHRRQTHTDTHTHPFNGPLSRTIRVSRYQKGKTNLDFTEARVSDISWAICKSAPRSRQITTPAPHYSGFLQARCPSCRPNNSVKALKARRQKPHIITSYKIH